MQKNRYIFYEAKKRKINGLTLYVTFSIGFVVVYTVAEFICTLKYGMDHSSLTPYVYGFFAGEVVLCGLLKIFKLKGENNDGNIN